MGTRRDTNTDTAARAIRGGRDTVPVRLCIKVAPITFRRLYRAARSHRWSLERYLGNLILNGTYDGTYDDGPDDPMPAVAVNVEGCDLAGLVWKEQVRPRARRRSRRRGATR
jgi:hypothetical protein